MPGIGDGAVFQMILISGVINCFDLPQELLTEILGMLCNIVVEYK